MKQGKQTFSLGIGFLINLLVLSWFPTSVQLMADPAGPGDWSKVRLFGHAYRSGGYTEKQYEFIKNNFHIHTVEKQHAKGVEGNKGTEDAAQRVAAKIVKANPACRVLIYWSTNTAYTRNYMTIKKIVAANPGWVEEVRKNTVRWIYPDTTAKNWWADTPGAIVKKSKLSGIFADGVPGAQARGHLEAVKQNLARVSVFKIYNGYRATIRKIYGAAETLKHADGVFCEAFFRSSVEEPRVAVKLMDAMLAIPPNKYILCRGAAGAFGKTHHFTLACYLIIANDYTFYSWGGQKNSYAADDTLTFWCDDFDRKIGKPLGKAKKKGFVYTRVFENCSVKVDLEAKTSSIKWGQDNR